jgi:hypothetical protein
VPSEPDALTLTWTPRVSEIAEATFTRNQEITGGGLRVAFGAVLALLGALMLVDRWTAPLALVLIPLALLLISFRVTLPLARRRWAAVLAANPVLGETCEVTFDGEGVHLASDRMSTSRLWSTFPSWSVTPGAVVLATSGTAAAHTLVVPDRAGSNAEVETLRRIVERHLGPPQSGDADRRSRVWRSVGARLLVVACILVPVGIAMARTHEQAGEWRPWPSEAPPLLAHDGGTYQREGGPTGRPIDVAGIDYTPGGGLVLVPWPPTTRGPATELWVLDHAGVVRHYVLESADRSPA